MNLVCAKAIERLKMNESNENIVCLHVMVHVMLFSCKRFFTYIALERRVPGVSESKTKDGV